MQTLPQICQTIPHLAVKHSSNIFSQEVAIAMLAEVLDNMNMTRLKPEKYIYN
jgi:hypothetical protein